MDVPRVVEVARERWLWHKTNWDDLRKDFEETNWEELLFLGEEPFEDLADEAVKRFTDHLLEVTRRHVTVERRVVEKSTHPWLNDRCRQLAAEERAAQGTPLHKQKLKQCSEGVFDSL